MADRPIRIAAVGDLHCRKTSGGTIAPLLAPVNDAADVLLLCGDLTDYGTVEEAHVLAKELAHLRVPIIGVLGNHDYEGGAEDAIVDVLTEAGVQILDGDAVEVRGCGFAGVKGFVGGFGRHTLGPWGEPMIKQFVHEAVNEALKLEAALARLRSDRLVALLHYAPVQQTVEGEPVEIYPFVGSSRLEEPIGRYPLSLVVHGHAHRGQLEGRTKSGVPVYNVSMPLLTRAFPDRPPFRVFEVPEPAAAPPAFPRGRRATDAVAS